MCLELGGKVMKKAIWCVILWIAVSLVACGPTTVVPSAPPAGLQADRPIAHCGSARVGITCLGCRCRPHPHGHDPRQL